MPPEALQEHFSTAPDNLGQFPDGLDSARQNVDDAFASIIEANYGADAAAEVRQTPAPADTVDRVAKEALMIGEYLGQIRQVVGGFDTPGTDEFPAGLGRAFKDGEL